MEGQKRMSVIVPEGISAQGMDGPGLDINQKPTTMHPEVSVAPAETPFNWATEAVPKTCDVGPIAVSESQESVIRHDTIASQSEQPTSFGVNCQRVAAHTVDKGQASQPKPVWSGHSMFRFDKGTPPQSSERNKAAYAEYARVYNQHIALVRAVEMQVRQKGELQQKAAALPLAERAAASGNPKSPPNGYNDKTLATAQEASDDSSNYNGLSSHSRDVSKSMNTSVGLKNAISMPTESHKKRMRRTAMEIDRRFRCPVIDCNKGYGTEATLLQHIRRKHPMWMERAAGPDGNRALQNSPVNKSHQASALTSNTAPVQPGCVSSYSQQIASPSQPLQPSSQLTEQIAQRPLNPQQQIPSQLHHNLQSQQPREPQPGPPRQDEQHVLQQPLQQQSQQRTQQLQERHFENQDQQKKHQEQTQQHIQLEQGHQQVTQVKLHPEIKQDLVQTSSQQRLLQQGKQPLTQPNQFQTPPVVTQGKDSGSPQEAHNVTMSVQATQQKPHPPGPQQSQQPSLGDYRVEPCTFLSV
eukprot:Selendium_serpulae@DN5974_c0_g1_i1.p1